MYGLDKYAPDVLLAYALGMALLAAIILGSVIQSKRAKKRLEDLE
ncbi:MAG: heme exporter protein CcmD [Pseudomonadota bacterium]